MSARRKLTAIDDPLFAPPTSPPVSPPAEPSSKKTAALYVELPVEQWDALARAAFELRAHKRQIIGAMNARHIDTSAEGLERLR